jgi:hypothetical protein
MPALCRSGINCTLIILCTRRREGLWGREGWKGGKEEELNSVVSNSEKLLCDMHLGKIGDMSRSPCHHRPSFCCVAVRRALAFCVVAVPGR